MTRDWTGAEKYAGTGWANTEFRSFHFLEDDAEGKAEIEETAESRERRRGSEHSPDETEKMEADRLRGTVHE